jgi:cytosine/adenosine deaminase-related metal-dependent hydrolase
MQIITPHFILLGDKVSTNLSVAFDKTIKKIAPFDTLLDEFPSAKVTTLRENSLLMPGLINAHVHIEFSANTTQLSYGDFLNWLYSVIENRDELINGCDLDCMSKATDAMLKNGITTFGAISSHGMDLEACANAKQNVVFFNELIGSQALMADTLFDDFKSRLGASQSVQREGFSSGVAIHSPYSVHPVLIKRALQIVREQKIPLTAHFMESEAERNWLDDSSGDFKDFFETLLKQKTNVSDAKEFLEHFDGTPTLLTHVVKAQKEELEQIATSRHTVIHCPISNRLLGNGAIDLQALEKQNIRWILATDGLSSNYKLDLFEEMKVALFMHSELPLLDLARKLIRSVTIDAANALGINAGEIAEGKNADMLILDLDKEPSEELAIHLILHRYNISKVYINGQLQKGEDS